MAVFARRLIGGLPLGLNMTFSIKKGLGVEKEDDGAHRRHADTGVAHRIDRHVDEDRDGADQHHAGDADPAEQAVPQIGENEGDHHTPARACSRRQYQMAPHAITMMIVMATRKPGLCMNAPTASNSPRSWALPLTSLAAAAISLTCES